MACLGERGRGEDIGTRVAILSLAASVAKISSFELPTVDGRLCRLASGAYLRVRGETQRRLEQCWMNDFGVFWLVESVR